MATTKKKPVNKALEIQRILESLRYYTHYDYDESRAGCDCGSICRCGRITNARVTSVDTLRLASDINACLDTEMDKYCAERILVRSGLNDMNAYNVGVVGGYYGQEIGSVTFHGTSPLPEILALLKDSTDLKKVLRALAYEYGYVLPSLMSKADAKIKEVPLSSIYAGQTDHYKRLDREAIKRYKESRSTLPQIVVVEDHGYYRIIDGYHRYAAAQGKEKIKVIIVS